MLTKTVIPFAAGLLLAAALHAQSPATASSIQPVTAPAEPDEFLTQEQLVQAFRAKQFQLVIHESSRIFANPKILKGYDDFNLQVLKAESYLQQKDTLAALPQFEDAVKRAPDDDRRAIMSATVLLLRRQQGLQYQTTSTDENGVPLPPLKKDEKRTPVAIDILSLARRNIAFKALFFDELAKMDGIIKAAQRGRSLPALTPAIKALDQIEPLEIAAAGTPVNTRKLQKAVAQNAQEMIKGALRNMRMIAEQKRTEAEKIVTYKIVDGEMQIVPAGPGATARPQGLPLRTIEALETMVDEVKKIPPATEELTLRLHLDAKFFQVTLDNVAATQKALEEAIDAGRNGLNGNTATTIYSPPTQR